MKFINSCACVNTRLVTSVVSSFLVHVEVHGKVAVICTSAVVGFWYGMSIFASWESIRELQNCHQDYVLCTHHSISKH